MKRVISLILTKTEIINRFWLEKLKMEVISTLRSHAVLISIMLPYMAACVIIARIYGVTEKISLTLYCTNVCKLGFWCFLIFFAGYSIYLLLIKRPDNIKEFALNDLQTNYLSTENLCNLLLIGLIVPSFLSAFTSFKIILPSINAFSWDASLAKLDAFMHGGKQPWQLLQPILGYPIVTSILSVFYYLWFFVMYGVLFWQALSLRDKQLRMQFFLTYTLSWIFIGTISAIALSSAGPCYYGYVVKDGNNVFAPLMDYLYSVKDSFPIKSISLQELLWSAYNGRETGMVKGISAMPSMHVSMSFIFVLLGWRTSRLAGIGFTIFAIIIMVGSVHLGWHYASDGYVAIILTSIIWYISGLISKRCTSSIDSV